MNDKTLTWLVAADAPQYVLDDFGQSDLKSKIDDLKEAGRKLLETELTSFFNKYPEITEFKWQQYTPYFNDGDPCYFGLYADEILYYQLCEEEDMSYEEYKQKYDSIDSELSTIMYSLETIFYEWLFGDHVEVTAKFVNDKVLFWAREYNHD